ncbi:MAG: L-rhamnose/proton symporter RhaT [Terriglobia bacterium]
MSSLSIGIMLAILAGILNGSFAAPTKYAKVWKWENIFSVFGIFGMVVFPWLVVFLTIPHPGAVYHGITTKSLLLTIGFGVGFGLAQIFFGLGIAAIGMALNFAIAIGISTVLGSLVPLLVLHRDRAFTPQGLMLLVGVLLILVGIVGCSVAGKLKDKYLEAADPRPRESAAIPMSFKAGLIICILAGLGSPLTNFALAFGDPLRTLAAAQGVSVTSQANVIWAPVNTAAFIPYIIYCIYLWKKNKTGSLFGASGTGFNWVFGAIMGALWFGSTVIYGAVSGLLGDMGPILGWPLFMSAIIIASNVWGISTGEWKGSGSRALNTMLGSIFFLILGFVALAYAGRLG